jgi:hypothetical protein
MFICNFDVFMAKVVYQEALNWRVLWGGVIRDIKKPAAGAVS